MSKLIIIYGNVSSGKGTLSNRLLKNKYSEAEYYCSDGIREELSGNVGGKSRGVTAAGKPFNVWTTFADRVNTALNAGKTVIADSTGMSQDFVKMVDNWRNTNYDTFVIRLFCDPNAWKHRELLRTDRWNLDGNGQKKPFEMPERAYIASKSAKFQAPADLEIDTTNLTPEEVYEQVVRAMK